MNNSDNVINLFLSVEQVAKRLASPRTVSGGGNGTAISRSLSELGRTAPGGSWSTSSITTVLFRPVSP